MLLQVYEPFFADFGPLNLACTYRFCWKLHHLLKVVASLRLPSSPGEFTFRVISG
jgi:hypothetical protein